MVPFEIGLPSESGYFLIYPEENANDPRLQAFRTWLLQRLQEEMPEHGDPLMEDAPPPLPAA